MRVTGEAEGLVEIPLARTILGASPGISATAIPSADPEKVCVSAAIMCSKRCCAGRATVT